MKKIVFILVIVLIGIAGWAGATYVIGGKIQQRYQESISRLEQWGPFNLTSESYQRGFLSSHARTLMEFSVPMPAEEEGEVETRTLRLSFEHQLRHGPLPGGGGFSLAPQLAHIETRLVAADFGQGSEDESLSELPWLEDVSFVSSIGFNGGGQGRLVIPAFEKTLEEEQLTIRWGGLRSDTRFSHNLEALAGDIELSGLQMVAKDGQLKWDGVRADFDFHEAFPLVYLGRYRADSGPMELTFGEQGNGPQKLRVEGFVVDSLASQSGETVEYLQSLKVAKVAVDDTGYGPGELEVAVSGLDGNVLSQYQRDVLGVYGQDSFDSEVIGLQMMQVYLRLLSGLVEGSPEIEFRKMQFTTPGGNFSGNLRLKLHGEVGMKLGDMAALLQKLEGQAQVTADESLIRTMLTARVAHQMKILFWQQGRPLPADEEITVQAGLQVEQQLEALIGQQFIERREDKLHCKAVFNQGELRVNGKRLM